MSGNEDFQLGWIPVKKLITSNWKPIMLTMMVLLGGLIPIILCSSSSSVSCIT